MVADLRHFLNTLTNSSPEIEGILPINSTKCPISAKNSLSYKSNILLIYWSSAVDCSTSGDGFSRRPFRMEGFFVIFGISTMYSDYKLIYYNIF